MPARPPGITTQFEGSALAFQSALANEVLLILAAIITVYIVLGVLYESFIHPVTILSTLPSAGVGALLALIITGHDLNIVSIIGIILLIGIVKKNAIMMIDFALEAERNEGKSPEEAIHQAALLRFRPILMTTVAALFGALPLMLGTGMGSELRHPLGISIVGGLLVSQLLTLFTTPVIYIYFDKRGPAIPRMARPPPGRPCRARTGAGGMSFVGALHPAPHRHHPAGAGTGAGRAGRLFPAAGRAASQYRHSHHRGQRQHAGRQPGDHVLQRGDAAGAASGRHRRGHRDDLAQQRQQHPDRAAVRHQPRHRRRGARRAGRDQCGARRSAGGAALQSHLPQVQSGRFPDPDPGADLQDPVAGADLRPGLQHHPAEAVADFRAWAMSR